MKNSLIAATVLLFSSAVAFGQTKGTGSTRGDTTRVTQGNSNKVIIVPRNPANKGQQNRNGGGVILNGRSNPSPGINNPGNVTTPGQDHRDVTNGGVTGNGTSQTGNGATNNTSTSSGTTVIVGSGSTGLGSTGGVGVGATGTSGTGIGATRNSIEAGGTGVGSIGSTVGAGTTGTANAAANTTTGTTDMNNNPAVNNNTNTLPSTTSTVNNSNSANRAAALPEVIITNFNGANAAATGMSWTNNGSNWAVRYMLGDTWLTTTYQPNGVLIDTRTDISLSDPNIIPPAVATFGNQNKTVKLKRLTKIERPGSGVMYELTADNNRIIMLNNEGQVVK